MFKSDTTCLKSKVFDQRVVLVRTYGAETLKLGISLRVTEIWKRTRVADAVKENTVERVILQEHLMMDGLDKS